jgi:hypothetical protein
MYRHSVTGAVAQEKSEFQALLVNLFYFNRLWAAFDAIDADDDRRLSFDEFQHGLGVAGLTLSPTEAQDAFDAMDVNGGGQILFDG